MSKYVYVDHTGCLLDPPIELPETNADKIRQMSDEELAEWLENIDTAFEEGTVVMTHGWLDWLKQEVESDG